jgi:hypothetical protein
MSCPAQAGIQYARDFEICGIVPNTTDDGYWITRLRG